MATRKKRFARLHTCFLNGFDGIESSVEISILPGLPTVEIVGLCDSSVRESKERVRASIRQLGFDFPSARITVGIFPSYIHKSGSSFDLPLAIGILIASGQIRVNNPKPIVAFGELTLTGSIRDTPGSVAKLASIQNPKDVQIIVPESNRNVAKLMGIDVVASCCLKQVISHLENARIESDCTCSFLKNLDEKTSVSTTGVINEESRSFARNKAFKKPEVKNYFDDEILDFSCLKGQEMASRALIISASGMHNLLMIGSPGSGKTTAAQILRGLLPPMTKEERIDHLKILSVSQVLSQNEIACMKRPFRYVHHSINAIKLLGNPNKHIPGELALSAHGILFLDEMAEFSSRVLDMLRQPLDRYLSKENHQSHSILQPSSFLMVGAMNPCRCGRFLDAPSSCTCSLFHKKQYYRRISGPILDRIDLFCDMHPLGKKALIESILPNKGNHSAIIRKQVKEAWDRQAKRCEEFGIPIALNGEITGYPISELFRFSRNVLDYSVESAEQLGLSARGLNKLLRVARTIADLDGHIDTSKENIAEAIHFRNKHFKGDDSPPATNKLHYIQGGVSVLKQKKI